MSCSRPIARSLVCVLLGALFAGTGCDFDSPGDNPPDDALFFPMGMALDPERLHAGGGACTTDAECGDGAEGWTCNVGVCRQASPLLYVAGANSDLRYNGGALQVYDLDGFFGALEATSLVQPPGAEVSGARPCRSLATRPQVAECLESAFARDAFPAHVGNFATDLEPWFDAATGRRLLMMPVRGDPSVVWFELAGPADSGFVDCAQGSEGGLDRARCGDGHRLRYLRDDTSLPRLSIEPYELTISPEPTRPLAYLTHTLSGALTLIDLRGLREAPLGEQDPIIIDDSVVFASSGSVSGGYGISERPCDPLDAPTLSQECVDDPNGGLTCEACARPVLYGGFRFARAISEMVAFETDPDDLGANQSCVAPGEIGTPGGLVCEPQIALVNQFSPGGLAGVSGGGVPRLGAMHFSADGNELYVVQSSPGALLRLDMSITEDGDSRRAPTGTVEVCPRPTEMTLYDDGSNQYALVSCYSVGQVYIVDLKGFQVVSVTQVGTGPHRMTADLAREVVYVGNTLDATISVIDMGDARPTRFSEIGRLGLQDPYSG